MFQEAYFGPAIGPIVVEQDSVIVISDDILHQYGTVKLGEKEYLCGSLEVYKSGHDDLYFKVMKDRTER